MRNIGVARFDASSRARMSGRLRDAPLEPAIADTLAKTVAIVFVERRV
jgi:hypothetical protein